VDNCCAVWSATGAKLPEQLARNGVGDLQASPELVPRYPPSVDLTVLGVGLARERYQLSGR